MGEGHKEQWKSVKIRMPNKLIQSIRKQARVLKLPMAVVIRDVLTKEMED